MKDLSKIIKKYSNVTHNDDNYSIGGGLDDCKFASRRHEDAKSDTGKLTEGQATAMFKKTTGLSLEEVKAVLNFAVPNMEWHHAGKLPKSYGGGMKKTYFLNSEQICDIATNWDDYAAKLAAAREVINYQEAEAAAREVRKQDFLKANAQYVSRSSSSPDGSNYITDKWEMNGKYGWFESQSKYNMPEYWSGWKFNSEEAYKSYCNNSY